MNTQNEIAQFLFRSLGETMAQSLFVIKPDGSILARAGKDLNNETQLSVLLAQIVAAFQQITGRGSLYRSLFFSYQDEMGRYALVSRQKEPFLAAVYLGKIHRPPPLGLTRFFLRRVYDFLLTRISQGLPVSHRLRVGDELENERALLRGQEIPFHHERGVAHQELQEALEAVLTEIRASLILAADDSGAVISVSGKSEHNPALIGALAAASLSAFREVERLTHASMQNAYALLEGNRNVVLILKKEQQPLVFVAVIPQHPGLSLGLARRTLEWIAKQPWRIERANTLTQLGLSNELPSTGELSLWGSPDNSPSSKENSRRG